MRFGAPVTRDDRVRARLHERNTRRLPLRRFLPRLALTGPLRWR